MLKAFVGIASDQGLAVLQPEREETLSYIHRHMQRGSDRIGFWAVLDDIEARCVQALFAGGLRREAMMFLDRTARDMGGILPNDPSSARH